MPDGVGIGFELAIFDIDGSPVETFVPATLEWSYLMKQAGPILAEIPLSDPLLTADIVAPKANDWELNIVTDALGPTEIAGGIVDSVNVVGNTQKLKVAGLDWLAWLDQPYWGFDYDLSVEDRLASDTAGDYGVAWSGADGDTQQDVVEDIIATLNQDSDDANVVPAFDGAAWGEELDYGISWGNAATVLQHLRTISDLFDPRGFDFWALWDKTIYCAGPRLLDPDAVTPFFTLDSPDVIVDYDWVNNGPASTDLVGYGPGTGNLAEYARTTYAPSIAAYRRWRRIMNLPPGPALTGSSTVTSRAAAQGYLERFPQKRLRLTVRPDKLDPADPAAGFYNFIGQAVAVDWPFPGEYHRIQADFWVTGQRYYFKKGAPMLDLTLDQLYA